MWFLYLDESGDLGFDFINKKPSKFFTVSILAINGNDNHRKLTKAAKQFLKRKLFHKKKVFELKGSYMILPEKTALYRQIKQIKFGIYSVTINKKKIYPSLRDAKNRLYNYVSWLVLRKIPFEKASSRVYLYIDKSKGSIGIKDFNEYISNQLKGRIPPHVPLDIFHRNSIETPGLQLADIFCNGIYRKYELHNEEWRTFFAEKIKDDVLYFK